MMKSRMLPIGIAFIRTIYEKDGEETEIILTGSNSELLSSELGSYLAGRFIEFFLLPFSFREFLAYRNVQVNGKSRLPPWGGVISMLFHRIPESWRPPEVFDIPSPEAKLSYLSGIVSKVILDDVVRRFRVDNVTLLEKLFHYLMAGAGSVSTFASPVAPLRRHGYQDKTGNGYRLLFISPQGICPL